MENRYITTLLIHMLLIDSVELFKSHLHPRTLSLSRNKYCSKPSEVELKITA